LFAAVMLLQKGQKFYTILIHFSNVLHLLKFEPVLMFLFTLQFVQEIGNF